MIILSDCKNSLYILSLLIYYNTNSIFSEHFFKNLYLDFINISVIFVYIHLFVEQIPNSTNFPSAVLTGTV